MNIVKEMEEIQLKSLLDLIEWAGGEKNLADLLNVGVPTVSNWKARGRISATMAAEAEKQSRGKFTKKMLRPEVKDWRI